MSDFLEFFMCLGSFLLPKIKKEKQKQNKTKNKNKQTNKQTNKKPYLLPHILGRVLNGLWLVWHVDAEIPKQMKKDLKKELRKQRSPRKKQDEEPMLELQFWDFAGQHVYYNTHQVSFRRSFGRYFYKCRGCSKHPQHRLNVYRQLQS